MTTKYSTLLLYTILLGAPLARAPICNADEFHSDSHGYRIELPYDWVEIPQDIIQEAAAPLLKQESAVSASYDAGFQLDSTDEWFEYPFVLVRTVPYAKFGLNRQLNEDQFSKFVRMLTNRDVGKVLGKVLDKNLSSLGRQIITNVGVGQPQIDVTNRRYLWTIDSEVPGDGPIRGLVVGYFGRDSLVHVMFYSRRADWDRHADLRATIIDSFRFDPDKSYSVEFAASNPSPPWIWTRWSQDIIAFCIVTGLLMLISVVVAVAKRNKTGVTQDVVDEDSR